MDVTRVKSTNWRTKPCQLKTFFDPPHALPGIHVDEPFSSAPCPVKTSNRIPMPIAF